MKATGKAASIETRKQNWRNLMGASRPGFCFLVNYSDPGFNLPPAPPIWPDKKAERIERKWEDYARAMDQAAWLDDDTVPALDMITGTEIFAEAMGCQVHRPDFTNPFAMPLIFDAAAAAKVKVPRLETSSLAYLFEMADELRRRAGRDAVFHLVDVQSPMDIAALIWEKSSFFVAMVEEPDAVKELSAKVRELLTAFLDEWFRRYGTEYVAHYPSYFMSGGMTLSEDEVGSVNADMFEEFFLPELNFLSARYGGLGMHCCADAGHQWEGFRAIQGLRLLNLVNPPTRKPEDYVKKAYPFFSEKCAQWHIGWSAAGAPSSWYGQYPEGSRVVIDVGASSRQQAIGLCEQLQSARSAT